MAFGGRYVLFFAAHHLALALQKRDALFFARKRDKYVLLARLDALLAQNFLRIRDTLALVGIGDIYGMLGRRL